MREYEASFVGVVELLGEILAELKNQGEETRAFRSATEATMASVSAQASKIMDTAQKINEPYTIGNTTIGDTH